ncbi:radical SAM family heme chaperone HemW [Sinisalibacter lacisalsi]|uniref:Heme chaperone HemW n=1 Tax=Sinisalibacter lacisalsi TaxID=1526570 RepID=A0ABQ1QAV0_9RHOB|nr:radical SAM family heme chaperone HemW [Sinisalibacter lacisalsi]GGD21457.1 coproporphyrinogen III oxidase [Sinisalibacter lacisalsi]
MLEDWRLGGFGLYIHWPFCESKCPYCDFNSHVSRSINQEAWRNAFLTALEHYARETPDRVLNSVYFGGGTPSLMDANVVGSVLEALPGHWALANDLEITLEANPSSVEAARFDEYRSIGVNRISLGIQALNDPDLKRLGRLHTASAALNALEIARSSFERVNFDLIYARQDQSLEAWREELQRALSFAPTHLSLYQLTIEQGTAFGDLFDRGKLPGLPEEDLAADMYDATQELCEAAGLPAYEVSNHARLGQESRHNLTYWRGGDYVGIGPGAHGRVTVGGHRYATVGTPSPNDWLKEVASGASGEMQRDRLSPEDHLGEYLMMGLRTNEGVDLARIENISRKPIKHNKIKDLIDIGMLEMSSGTLRVTRRGRAVLNSVTTALLPD